MRHTDCFVFRAGARGRGWCGEHCGAGGTYLIAQRKLIGTNVLVLEMSMSSGFLPDGFTDYRRK